MFGFWKVLIVLVVLMLLFGGRRLPALGQAFGRMLHNFKHASASRDEIEVSTRPRGDKLSAETDAERSSSPRRSS